MVYFTATKTNYHFERLEMVLKQIYAPPLIKNKNDSKNKPH